MRRIHFIIPILIILTAIHSCIKKAVSTQVSASAPISPVTQHPSNALKNYLALGDSYTIGHGVPPAESYPVQAKNWRAANGIN